MSFILFFCQVLIYQTFYNYEISRYVKVFYRNIYIIFSIYLMYNDKRLKTIIYNPNNIDVKNQGSI